VTYLEEIVERRRADLAAEKNAASLSAFRERAARRTDRRDFVGALSAGAPVLIAEFKRRSPSLGTISAGADPARFAAACERGGAAALSVVTEPRFFGGGFADLRAVRAATRLPVLCKDFMVEEYQLWQAAAAGADAVLLIAALFDDRQLELLVRHAGLTGLDALVEVHDAAEARRALRAGASAIGINNRDLHTFTVDVGNAIRVRRAVSKLGVTIGESGYQSRADVAAAGAAGLAGVLVGTILMRARNPESAIRRLRGGAA